jgi:CHASE3 domain sensor protein
MLKNLKNKIRKNIQIFGLIFLIAITVVSTSYFNFKKNNNIQAYNNFIDNIYFKKTLSHLVDNLEPNTKKLNIKLNLEKLLTKF